MMIIIVPIRQGGWAEPYELDLFEQCGFQQVTLGTRILRTDVAVVSLLGLAQDACYEDDVFQLLQLLLQLARDDCYIEY